MMLKRIAVVAALASLAVPTASLAQRRDHRRPRPAQPAEPAEPAPQIKRMTPQNGPVGTKVVVRGMNLAKATGVKVGQQDVPFKAFPKRIVFSLPSSVKPGPRNVQVTFPNQPPMAAGSFVVDGAPAAQPPPPSPPPAQPPPPPPPEIRPNIVVPVAVPKVQRMDPASGGAGTRIIIQGANLDATTSVRIGGQPASFKAGKGRVAFSVPLTVAPGQHRVMIGFEGRPPVMAGSFEVLAPPPIVDNFEPRAGVPGADVVIHGSNLQDAKKVRVGGQEVAFRAFPRRIIFSLPPSIAPGPRQIMVGFLGRPPLLAGTIAVGSPAPRILGLDPVTGGPGTRVVIRGTNLGDAQKVKVAGMDVPYKAFPDQIIFTVPAAAPGPAPVRVRFPAGPPVEAGRFTVAQPLPEIQVIDPPFGIPGTRVVLRGFNLQGAEKVRIGRDEVQFKAAPNRIIFNVPPSVAPGAQAIKVRFAGLRPMSVGTFQVDAPQASIGRVIPTGGLPGTRVVVYGRNLNDAQNVTVGGQDVPYRAFPGQLVFSVPDTAAPGPRQIIIRFSNQPPMVAGSFVVDAPLAQVNVISPPAGGPGTRVVLRGRNLEDVQKVKIGGIDVPFKADPRRIIFVVPAAVPPGLRRVMVTFPSAPPMLAGDFAVDGAAAVAVEPLELRPEIEAPRRRWRHYQRPVISGYSPITGTPGTKVTIRGRNFPLGTLVMYGEETLTPLSLGPREVVFAVPRGRGIVNVGLLVPNSKEILRAGTFDVTRKAVSNRELKIRVSERRKRATRRWQERRRELARLSAEERRASYLRLMAERERTRAERREARRERLRAQWQEAVLSSPDVQAEMSLHSERMARLSRMLWLAELENMEKLVIRVEMLKEREDERHQQRMNLLKVNLSN